MWSERFIYIEFTHIKVSKKYYSGFRVNNNYLTSDKHIKLRIIFEADDNVLNLEDPFSAIITVFANFYNFLKDGLFFILQILIDINLIIE